MFAALDERIEKLKQIFVQEDGDVGKRHEEALAALRETYGRRLSDCETQLNALHDERRNLQRQYERLRLQKGGVRIQGGVADGSICRGLGVCDRFCGSIFEKRHAPQL